ncbi:hypothetical protein [Dyadobacter luticola]|uniref:Uncharacterized protein n=1 Tax=Dyadobacter luticola TaxID=1979387 RepID=A0A5R9L0W8_9BACT|nr:hypothetical protein [Dyadobacter luticola]TLV02196.1 hypothetical protein FEN17_00715 [Dyadobacter luticola]
MNFKIINLPESQTDVCLHRDCGEDGKEIVRISAFVINSAGVELMVERVAEFRDVGSAKFFVDDYSERSAKGFLKLCVEEEGIRVGHFAADLAGVG